MHQEEIISKIKHIETLTNVYIENKTLTNKIVLMKALEDFDKSCAQYTDHIRIVFDMII